MNIQTYFEIITTYQINITAIALISIAIIIGIVFFYYTNDLKPALLALVSILLVPALTLTTLFIYYEYFNVEPSEKHTLIMWSTLFLNIINIGILISKYAREALKKKLDLDYVLSYHFSSTLDLFLVLIVTIGAISIFMKSQMHLILLPILVISSIIIWFNHLLARFLLKKK